MGPRTVSEVCGFMRAPDKSFHDMDLVPDINVSILSLFILLTTVPLASET